MREKVEGTSRVKCGNDKKCHIGNKNLMESIKLQKRLVTLKQNELFKMKLRERERNKETR